VINPEDIACGRGDRLTGLSLAGRSPVLAKQGMAATAQPLASQVAVDILKRGGSAVDAAIAANATLGLMEPMANGIGGDLFALVWDPKKKQLKGLNASGRSPAGRSYDELISRLDGSDHIPALGSLSVTVPGAVDGWFEMHNKFGKLPMSELLAPAIQYCREGFPVSQYIAEAWAGNMAAFEHNKTQLEEFENARQTYLLDGRAPAVGEVFHNPDLADTLEEIGSGGRDAFYGGRIAQTIDQYMRRIGGDLRASDLAANCACWVEPITTSYRGYEVCQLPPNTQGLAVLQMLNVIEGFDIASMGAGSADALHVQIEAKRLAFEDRARYYSDPQHADVPFSTLASKAYADQRRKLIDMNSAMVNVVAGDPILEHNDTTYLTVADSAGMMVSLIQSNYRGMGSGLVPDGLGFMFQDRGELFSLDPEHPNVYAPGKLPFHTIIPGFILKDGEAWLSFGVMGGSMQPQGQASVAINLIDFGMNVQEAGDAARYRHEGSSEPTGEVAQIAGMGQVLLESGISDQVFAELRRRGHQVSRGTDPVTGRREHFGSYQAILKDSTSGVYHGASEMRVDGAAIGF
jgi:gamma-glutamyltranspeptidase/glutathione hydrolase